MGINKDREYVLLSIKWSNDGMLMFWGIQTKDDEERSYSGYTMDINECEKYTIEELESKRNFPFYKGESLGALFVKDISGTWAIKISDLDYLGKKKTIYWF